MKFALKVWLAILLLPIALYGAFWAIFLGATHPDWLEVVALCAAVVWILVRIAVWRDRRKPPLLPYAHRRAK
jgi:hypothetical protein